MRNVQYNNRACPSLGLLDDEDTLLDFPSVWNYCHRARPIVPPNIKHQAEFCLCENYQHCPVFLREQTAPLSEHLRAPLNRTNRIRGFSRKTFVVILVAISIIALLGWVILNQKLFLPTVVNTPSSVPIVNIPIAASASFPKEIIPTILTQPHTMTATIPPESATGSFSKHQLDMPIGTDYKFVFHRVKEGENLDQYASQYNTSIEAIVLVNYNLKTPVWIDTVVIIPVDIMNVAGLPAFEVYNVLEPGNSLDILAEELAVDAADLKYYNALNDTESLLVGDWLLIPHPRSAP